MEWQDLEGQIAAQRDGMEELAGRTHQLVEENDQVDGGGGDGCDNPSKRGWPYIVL